MSNNQPDMRNRADAFRRFWWIDLAGYARCRSALLGAAWVDGFYLNAWPLAAVLLPWLALLTGLIFGALHPQLQILHPPQAVFAQSRLLLFVAAILGALGAQFGLLLTLGYAAGEMLFTASPLGPAHASLFYTLFRLKAPRLATYALLLALAVQPVLVARSFAASVAPVLRRLGERREAAIWLLASLLQGGLVWGWVHAAPAVMRLPWLWVNDEPEITFFDFWTFARYLPCAAATALLARGALTALARRRDMRGEADDLLGMLTAADAKPGRFRRLPPLAGQLGLGLLTTLFLLGLVVTWIRAATLIVIVMALFLARLYLLPRLTLWTRLMRRTPPVLRWLAGIAVTFAVAKGGMALPWSDVDHNAAWGAFGAELASIGVGLAATLALFPLPAGKDGQPAKIAPRGRDIAMLALVVYFLSTRAGYALCLDPSCCFGTNGRAALAILGGMMLATAFPLLGATEAGLQALLGDLLGHGEGAVAGDLPGVAPGAGGGRTVMHDDGSFSIVSWTGYPAGVPMPGGPFNLASPDEVAAAQAAANGTVTILSSRDGAAPGTLYYPIRPLGLGGSGTDPNNWLAVTPSTGASLNGWWNRVLDSVIKMPDDSIAL